MSASRTELGDGVRRHLPAKSDPGLSGVALRDRSIELALKLGFARAAAAPVGPFENSRERLESFLAQGRAGEMHYLAQRDERGELLRLDPKNVFPKARSALIVALPYRLAEPVPARPLHGGIAGYAQCPDYHAVLKALLLELADGICESAGRALESRVCVDSAPLLERDLAVRAGLAFLGKNTLAIAPGAGSSFVLGALLLDLALAPSDTRVPDGCGACTACLTACPTDAFAAAYELDARRCISYLTIEHQGAIPNELRSQLGHRVFGCDACQTVCPYNQSRHLPPAPPAFAPLGHLAAPELGALLNLSNSEHKRLVKGTALRRASREQLARNAAVALGNSGRVEAIDPLANAAAHHQSVLVRDHAMSALAQLAHSHGIDAARRALEALSAHTDPETAQQAQSWLRSGGP